MEAKPYMLNMACAVSFCLAVALTVLFLLRVVARDPVEIRTHWGGLGGTTAGWRASPSLVALIAASVAWLMAAAFGLYASSIENQDLRDELRRSEEKAKAELEDQRTKLTREFEIRKLKAERDLERWKAEREFDLRQREIERSAKPAANAEVAKAPAGKPAKPPPPPPAAGGQ